MKRISVFTLSLAILLGISHTCVFAQARKTEEREPDSAYVEKEDAPRQSEGGLFDFLPFVGRDRTRVEPEKLEPTPPPRKRGPILKRNEMQQLREATERWVLTTEFGEPTIRQDANGGYYRDYIVFADEYEAKVLRGDSEERPFIGHIYIKGDYFKTRSHAIPEDARSDFKFNYETREFRIIFERITKWEYSTDPAGEPFSFVERWEFGGLQSRPTVNLTEDPAPPKTPETPEKEEAATPAPTPEGD